LFRYSFSFSDKIMRSKIQNQNRGIRRFVSYKFCASEVWATVSPSVIVEDYANQIRRAKNYEIGLTLEDFLKRFFPSPCNPWWSLCDTNVLAGWCRSYASYKY
jgi:hypothetical protein